MGTYQPPLDQLLRLGETELGVEWPEYRGMGLGPEHVPELVRMATDSDLILQADEEGADEAQAWACEHAMRAMAQLGAVEAVGPLLERFDRVVDLHDFWIVDLAEVMAVFGPGALPALEQYLADPQHDERHRTALCDSFIKIAEAHPEQRGRVVEFLSRQLLERPDDCWTLNGFLVGALLDLEATEAAPAIEQAFEQGRVDASIAGDWPLVRYELGLGPLPTDSPYAAGYAASPHPAHGREVSTQGPGGSHRPDLKKLKKKRKDQQKARKQARKRKG